MVTVRIVDLGVNAGANTATVVPAIDATKKKSRAVQRSSCSFSVRRQTMSWFV
jgi:hypothetical protein